MADQYDLRAGAATIVIDDGAYAGVEAVVQLDAPYRVRREVRRLNEEYVAAEPYSDEEAAALDAIYAIASAEVILSWNVTVAGDPVPVSLEGLHRTSPALVMGVLTTWWQYVGTVMPPLPVSSPSTASSSESTSGDSSDGPAPAGSATTPALPSTP